MKTNYDLILENIIKENINKKIKPTLLLHTCCAPCSSSVILRLKDFFKITIYYYNPNIEPIEEYSLRKKEQIRFIKDLNTGINFIDCDYENEKFKNISKNLEHLKEGGIRCHKCFKLRLMSTAIKAKELNFDYFGTTLTVSPYKNSQIINEIGKEIETELNIKFLYSDFKKKEGYKKSIELSKEYDLYRQNYCGCIFSKKEMEEKELNNKMKHDRIKA